MPAFDLTLAPYRRDDAWAGFDVRYRVELDSVPAGDVLLTLPDVFVSMPGARVEDLVARDESGGLLLTEVDPMPRPQGVYRAWVADRATNGPVEVDVRAPVREIDERTPVGPLLDLRPEPLGLFGAGGFFIPLPTTDDVFEISVRFDLPDGATAVTTRGPGDQTWTGPLETVVMSFFGAGTPVIEPADSPDFAIHAYSDVNFDLVSVAEYVRALHGRMSAFFEDDGASYHVLVRQFLGRGSGGTALPPGSFAFGYSVKEPKDSHELQLLLAHEMTHNWPHLDFPLDISGATSWFSEGAAEYYSLVLSHRFGLLGDDEFAAEVTERFAWYDANPLRGLTNDGAIAAYWTDPRAQRLPYGRGFQHLIATDMHIRNATDGQHSLDDVVIEHLRLQRAGEPNGVARWLDRLVELCGEEARTRHDLMVAGRPIEIPDGSWEGLVANRIQLREVDLGFDTASYRTEPRLVTGLVAGGPAETAGVRAGDQLVDRALPYQLTRTIGGTITLPLLREGRSFEVEYVPAGAAVPSLRWTPADSA